MTDSELLAHIEFMVKLICFFMAIALGWVSVRGRL